MQKKAAHSLRLGCLALLFFVLSTPTSSTLAGPPPPPDKLFPNTRTARSDTTGYLTFIGAQTGQPLPVRSAMAPGITAEARAGTVLQAVAPYFGVSHSSDLVASTSSSANGRLTARYQQYYRGIPVLAGEMVLNISSRGELLSASGEASPHLALPVTAAVSADSARQQARDLVARDYRLSPQQLTLSEPQLWLYDPRLIMPSDAPAELVWRVEVQAPGLPLNELVLVNAHHGGVSLHFNQINSSSMPVWGQSDTVDSALKAAYDEGSGIWYVRPNGLDSHTCNSPAAACASINGVMAKDDFSAGDEIRVALGQYTGTGNVVVSISQNVTISGGWDEAFSSQTGLSVLDGERHRRLLAVTAGDAVQISGFDLVNGNAGILVTPGAGLTMLNDQVRGHIAGEAALVNKGTVTIISCSFSGNLNQESFGGAIINDHGNMTIVNSTISGNSSLNSGAGIRADGGSLLVNSSTISGNFSYYSGGGAVYSAGAALVTLYNSILADNANIDPNYGPDCRGVINSGGYNLLGVADSPNCSYTAASGDLLGSSSSPLHPKLGQLMDNGGLTQTQALSEGSPALEAGSPSTPGSGGDSCAAADQRGLARPVDERCDIGAFEGSQPWLPFARLQTYNARQHSELPGSLLCLNWQPACTNGSYPFADTAHRYAGDAWAFYWGTHGRDSFDDTGMPVISSVYYDDEDPDELLEYDSFWNGEQMVYGYAVDNAMADDIVGHEYTHGVTAHTSALFNFYQSGAIAESFADMWGEFIDLGNNAGNDSPQVRWIIGEDAQIAGALRNMADPPHPPGSGRQLPQPDRMLSNLFSLQPWDNGGVHINGGVNNKAVALMVDGGSFNKQTIQGIGIDKIAAIYYNVQTRMLTSGADYQMLYHAVYQACLEMIGGSQGVTSGDCVQVHKALIAVEMDQQPKKLKNEVDVCPNGQQPQDLFYDGFEDGLAAWEMEKRGHALLPYWSITGDNVYSGQQALYGPDDRMHGETVAAMKSPLSIPMGGQTYVHFEHMYSFDGWYWRSDDPNEKRYTWKAADGGVVQYSLDSGASWLDAAVLFDKQGEKFKGRILVNSNYNGFGGENAFTRSSNGWASSRLLLNKDAAIPGSDLQLRFGIGSDMQTGGPGWWVDEFRIYNCVEAPPAPPSLLKPADGATIVGAPLHSWKGDKKADQAYQLQYVDEGLNEIYLSGEISGTKYQPAFNLVGDYYWRVRAKGSSGESGEWSPLRKLTLLRAVPAAPALVSPPNKAASNNLMPNFQWGAVAYSGNGYQMQLSHSSKFDPALTAEATVPAGITEYTAEMELTPGVYYWRVRAQNADEVYGKWSKTSQFSIDIDAPCAPLLALPKHSSFTSSTLPRFGWKFCTKDSRQGWLQVDSQPDLASGALMLDQQVAGTKWGVPKGGNWPYGRYFWRVFAIDWAGNAGDWSDVFSFDLTLMTSPKPGSSIKGDLPTFKWKAHPAAKTAAAPQYRIQLHSSEDFSAPLYDWFDIGNAARYTSPEGLNPGVWYWRLGFSPDGVDWEWMPAWLLVI